MKGARKFMVAALLIIILSFGSVVSAADYAKATFATNVADVNIGTNLIGYNNTEYMKYDSLASVGVVAMWSEDTKSLTILGKDKKIVMKLNSTVIAVNGEQQRIEYPIVKLDGEVYMHMYTVCGLVGYSVYWDYDTSSLNIKPALDVVTAYQESEVKKVEKLDSAKVRINNKMKQMSRDMLVVVKEDAEADISAVDDFNKFMLDPNGLVYGEEVKTAIAAYAPDQTSDIYDEMYRVHNYLYKCDNIVTFVPVVRYQVRKDITVVFGSYMSDREITVDDTFAEFNQYYEDTTGRLMSEKQKQEVRNDIAGFIDRINKGCIYSFMIYNGEIIQIEANV